MHGKMGLAMATVLVIALVATACGTTAAPNPTAAAATKPVATEAQATKPGASADWKAEWDKIVAAAKKEGKVVVGGGPGEPYRKASMPFQKAYPDIQLEYSGWAAQAFMPKLLAERQGDQYLWDLYFDGGGSPLLMLKPKGALDPLKPGLVLPEVLDNAKWLGGFDESWSDKDRQYVFAYQGALNFIVYVNRNVVPESELSSVDQLLDPKWKGKIASGDPRIPGPAAAHFPNLLYAKGEEWLRKLFRQDIVVITDERQLVEFVIRGGYPIVIGTAAAAIEAFRQEGVMGHVKPLEPDSLAGAMISGGHGHLMLINKAPHPNAAKVFANWVLSAEGQKAYVEATNLNSRRLDVPGPPEFAPKPNVKYVDVGNKEDLLDYKTRAADIAKELLR